MTFRVVIVLLLFFTITILAESKVYEADPQEPTVKEAANFAADYIIEREGWKGGLNVIFSATRQVYDGFLYQIELEVITEFELIVFTADVFKDMGSQLSVKSYKIGKRRFRPDKQLSKKKKEDILKKPLKTEL